MSFYTVEYFQKRKHEMEEVFNIIKPDLQELADYFLPRSQFKGSCLDFPIMKSRRGCDRLARR